VTGDYVEFVERLEAIAADLDELAIDRARARSGASLIASANPGCSMHLGAVLDCGVRHPVDIVAEALR
jgi:Fe-S oxidoreductase